MQIAIIILAFAGLAHVFLGFVWVGIYIKTGRGVDLVVAGASCLVSLVYCGLIWSISTGQIAP